MSTASLLNQPPADRNQPYVFISYARSKAPRDTHAAEQIEAALLQAGIHCFRDVNIQHRSRQSKEGWDLKIEQALRECTDLILLVSPHSMSDERDEVYREWFYFVWKRKPLIAFQLDDCEPHSRLLSRNLIDARADLQNGIQELLTALQVKAPEYRTEDVLTQYYCDRIAEWSTPRYALDKRFVNLTLSFDQGEEEQQRWKEFQPAENRRFDDLRDVLTAAQNETKDARALVLLGNPGSGKSTLLRRLQLDRGKDRLRDGDTEISFFVPLNEYKGEQKPYDWLMAEWKQRYPNLPKLENFLPKGQVLFLLDALNEMQIPASAYRKLIGQWKEFIQDVTRLNNRIIFSCRSLDYSTPLSSKELPVPHIGVQPLTSPQINDFLKAYVPELAPRIWNELKDSPQLELFQTPYFLKLLVEQAEATGELPKGRAGLFTGFVRKALLREVEAESELFQPGTLLTERDCRRLTLNNQWESPFDLPERGALIPDLSGLAFSMQKNDMKDGAAQVALDYDEACDRIIHQPAEEIIKAGTSLNILDEAAKLKFFHQSLQEYFAARRLTKEPDPALVRVEWATDKVHEKLEKTLAGLVSGDPLPPLPQTGWEETTLTAAPMTKAPESFIHALMEHNLPLAARCAASPEINISDHFKREIQDELVARTQDMKADLRARIAAGEALGLLG